MPYFAHSGTPGNKNDWQTLAGHLNETAELAATFAERFGLERLAFITGLFHDLGKYDPQFQRRLEGANIRVDHSTAGAAVLRELAKGEDTYHRLMVEIAAYAILGHHAGLPDKSTSEPSCFVLREKAFQNRLDPAWEQEIQPDLAGIVPDWLPKAIHPASPHWQFDASVVARFLFSCLVDADFKNTEKFYAHLEKREVDRKWPALQDLLPEFRARFDDHMAGLTGEGDLNVLRRGILTHMRSKATMPPGLFTLTVPTGGGKTLASLGFALDHAAAHGHRRIIYAIPFTRARIETDGKERRCRARKVARSRGRGSKHVFDGAAGQVRGVARSRGRGSKQDAQFLLLLRDQVARSRGRGSKPARRPGCRRVSQVARSRGRGSKQGNRFGLILQAGRPLIVSHRVV